MISSSDYPGLNCNFTPDQRGEFLARALELRAQRKMDEVVSILGIAQEGKNPELMEVWTNPAGSNRVMFTLTRSGTFRCWARPFRSYDGMMGHFDAGGSTALLFEAYGGYREIFEWATKWFVGKMHKWQSNEHPGDVLWVG